MNPMNLSTCWAPNILRRKDETPENIIADSPHVSAFVSHLIENAPSILVVSTSLLFPQLSRFEIYIFGYHISFFFLKTPQELKFEQEVRISSVLASNTPITPNDIIPSSTLSASPESEPGSRTPKILGIISGALKRKGATKEGTMEKSTENSNNINNKNDLGSALNQNNPLNGAGNMNNNSTENSKRTTPLEGEKKNFFSSL